ncbi:HNH endonuclease signature motif containing protein [Streptomyces sp. NL15-2K]|uniref:HNH endonuclease signature motif containing protein n=1 Tax=Streptomyces sp. NL15-2K TaxID=376149 RepID=UPI00209C2B15|nr:MULTISPECIES: HNH endonuclease signature motif containing protein [Actinomycetes]WKX16254.1 HNH endonuclease signature motif containing protein [Kutzneria buriramensis]
MCQKCGCELDPGRRGPAPTAEVAHIRALRNGGARAVPGLSIEERNSIDNLILLCPQCHDLVDKDEGKYTISALLKIKAENEERAAALRQSGQSWRMRFASIDYLNLPRVAAMPGANVLLKAAEEVSLDIERPFREQGATSGFFIAKIHPLFAVWDARATQLTDETVAHVQHGQMVAFEQSMRARNTSSLPVMPKSMSWENAPQLVCTVGKRKVRIRFDADWITTATPVVDIKSAARRSVVYAGLGQVVGITDTEIFVSARLFGQPQTSESAMWDYLKSSRNPGPDTLLVDDFVNELSTLQQPPSKPVLNHGATELKTVALHFDEDAVIPEQIERELFAQILRVVPEFRRDVRVAVYSMPLTRVAKSGVIVPSDVAVGILAAKRDLWKTLAVPEMTTLIHYKNVAIAKVEGVSIQQADDLHSVMKEVSSSYAGAVEVDLELDAHRLIYEDVARYRLVQSDLRLLWSELERALSGDDIDDKLSEWEASGLFGQVSWEDGPGLHDAEIRALGNEFVRWLAEDDNR